MLKICPVLIKTKLIFSLEEPVKEEEKIEPSCVKIETGIAPNHGLVLGFYIFNYFVLLQIILKCVMYC